MRRALLLTLAFALPACTFQRGEWFADLTPTFEGLYELEAARDAGDGWQKLDTDYQVRVDAATMTFDPVELVDLGEGALSFDPANPPPGYFNCHNGHCHTTAGGIATYEEIEAELTGGAPAGTVVVVLPVGTVDVIVDARMELECVPGCGLPRANIRRAKLPVDSLAFAGLFRDGRVPARFEGEVPFAVDLALAELAPPETEEGEVEEPATLVVELNLPVDRSHAPDVTLAFTLGVGAQLFDGIDVAAALGTSSTLALDGTSPAASAILENLGEARLSADIRR